jgi:hypothetical protein
MPEFAGFALPDNPWALAALVIAAARRPRLPRPPLHLVELGGARSAARPPPTVSSRSSSAISIRCCSSSSCCFSPTLAPLPPKAQGAIHQLLSVLGLVIGIVLATNGRAARAAHSGDALRPLQYPRPAGSAHENRHGRRRRDAAARQSRHLAHADFDHAPASAASAVAIGLQDTLGNFFAGLYLKVDRPVDIGHYVKLQSGEEGYVERIGWRSTRIRMLPNNHGGRAEQQARAGQHHELSSPRPRAHRARPRSVSRTTATSKRSSASRAKWRRKSCRRSTAAVRGFTPVMRYQSFGQSSIDLIVALRAREFTDSVLIKHEFIKRLHARYAKEGITLPYPTRTVYVKTDGDAGEAKT